MKTRLVRLTLLAISLNLPLFAADTALVRGNSAWKYLNDGSNQGTAWRASGFNDSSWPEGAAELGYGDGDETTFVPYGPDPDRKPITTYFRQTFFVVEPGVLASLKLRLIRDDGAIVYVNGQEVFRSNMPAGAVAYNTVASGNSTGSDESAWHETAVDPSLLVAGTNTVAVEIHQEYSGSSDMSFALELLGSDGVVAASIRRGPYLQLGTPTSIVVRWRTDLPTAGRVRYGTSADNLDLFADDPEVENDHSVTLTDLSPFTKYYYSVGTPTVTLAGDASYTFLTSPQPGTSVPTQIWVLGDSGSADGGARAVRTAYYNRFGTGSTNLWLMLGDNAYDNGTDADYQAAVFNMYPEMLRTSVLWPTIGNHDTAQSAVYSPEIAYYDIFTLPTHGEAGGEASGTERYYSFDYGNIHFVCLDSMTTDRSPLGPMMTWLRNDLATTRQKWIIAFWHHPPYSKGGHDSDTEVPLVEMRENALPILEEYGVDLVLAGHSHSYERSYLIDGHYGHSSTFVSSMKVDGGDGRAGSGGAYRKPGMDPHEGAVYAVAGSSGQASGNGPLNHPAMFISLLNLGSLVLDVSRDELHGQFLRENGTIADTFTINKAPPPPPTAPSALAVTTTVDSATLTWTDTSTSEDGFRIERCTGTACGSFAAIASVAKDTTSYTDANLVSSTTYRYRVLAYNGRGSNVSNAVEATTFAPLDAPSALSATAVTDTRIDLAWTDASSNEDGFRVERCTGADCTSFELVETVAANATAYTNTGLTAATLYRYRIVAFNAVSTAASNVAEGSTLSVPEAPASLTADAVSTTRIDLAWSDASSNEEGFRVERCTGADCTAFALVETIAANATTYSDNGLDSSTLYRYRVSSFNGAGAASSSVAEASTKTPVPAAPGGLTATTVSTSQINLAWTDNSTNETGFRVERCSGADCTAFVSVATLDANVTSFSNMRLAAGTLYRYRVVAHNAGGGEASNIAEATTRPAPPAAPASLTATVVSPGQVNLAWTDNSTNEDGFRIQRCTGPGCANFVQVAQVAANVSSWPSTGLSPSTTYRYRVVAFNITATAASNIVTATTPAAIPAAPSGLTATAGAAQVSLAWNDNSLDETGFRVQRCAGAGCTDWTVAGELGANARSFTDTSIVGSTTYRYFVVAVNSAGSSPASNVAEVRTGVVLAAPSGLTLASITSTSATIRWNDNSPDETSFKIERCAGSSCTNFQQIGQTGAGVTTFTDAGLWRSQTFRYRVRAANASGKSAYSDAISVRTPNG